MAHTQDTESKSSSSSSTTTTPNDDGAAVVSSSSTTTTTTSDSNNNLLIGSTLRLGDLTSPLRYSEFRLFVVCAFNTFNNNNVCVCCLLFCILVCVCLFSCSGC